MAQWHLDFCRRNFSKRKSSWTDRCRLSWHPWHKYQTVKGWTRMEMSHESSMVCPLKWNNCRHVNSSRLFLETMQNPHNRSWGATFDCSSHSTSDIPEPYELLIWFSQKFITTNNRKVHGWAYESISVTSNKRLFAGSSKSHRLCMDAPTTAACFHTTVFWIPWNT